MADNRIALYFGCGARAGHHLRGSDLMMTDAPSGLPWNSGHMDGGLLTNGRIPDKADGRVFWTCGGRPELWFAFYWWDNSVDGRGGSNSGFYVRGFEPVVVTPSSVRFAAPDAFKYACGAFPQIVARQKFPLALQVDL